MKRIVNVLMVFAIFAVSGISCLKQGDVDEPTPVVLTDIVTYRGRVEEGTLFQNPAYGYGGMQRLLDPRGFELQDVAPGTRVLMDYSAELNDTMRNPIPIRAHAIYKISYDTVRIMSRGEIENLPRIEGKLISSWPSGNYINVQVSANYDGTPIELGLATEQGTIGGEDSKELRLYLYRKNSEPDAIYMSRRSIGSFYLNREYFRGEPKVVTEY